MAKQQASLSAARQAAAGSRNYNERIRSYYLDVSWCRLAGWQIPDCACSLDQVCGHHMVTMQISAYLLVNLHCMPLLSSVEHHPGNKSELTWCCWVLAHLLQQGRVVDHRCGTMTQDVEGVMSGEKLGLLVEAMQEYSAQQRLVAVLEEEE